MRAPDPELQGEGETQLGNLLGLRQSSSGRLPEVIGNAFICVYFNFWQGRIPEEYLVSWLKANPQNNLKLVKPLQEPRDTNPISFMCKSLAFGNCKYLVVWPVLWKGRMNSWKYSWGFTSWDWGMQAELCGAEQILTTGPGGELIPGRYKRKRAEVSGRGLSFSPDTLWMMSKLCEPASHPFLERGKCRMYTEDWMRCR